MATRHEVTIRLVPLGRVLTYPVYPFTPSRGDCLRCLITKMLTHLAHTYLTLRGGSARRGVFTIGQASDISTRVSSHHMVYGSEQRAGGMDVRKRKWVRDRARYTGMSAERKAAMVAHTQAVRDRA